MRLFTIVVKPGLKTTNWAQKRGIFCLFCLLICAFWCHAVFFCKPQTPVALLSKQTGAPLVVVFMEQGENELLSCRLRRFRWRRIWRWLSVWQRLLEAKEVSPTSCQPAEHSKRLSKCEKLFSERASMGPIIAHRNHNVMCLIRQFPLSTHVHTLLYNFWKKVPEN